MTMTVGITSERSYTVTPDVTADALAARDGSEGLGLPLVWSTPDMISRMEMVCAGLAGAFLEDSQMTVGARNEISHLAPTPVGATVRVRAELEAIDGRKLTFRVSAADAYETVGEGVHVRFIVDRSRFEARLQSKR